MMPQGAANDPFPVITGKTGGKVQVFTLLFVHTNASVRVRV